MERGKPSKFRPRKMIGEVIMGFAGMAKCTNMHGAISGSKSQSNLGEAATQLRVASPTSFVLYCRL